MYTDDTAQGVTDYYRFLAPRLGTTADTQTLINAWQNGRTFTEYLRENGGTVTIANDRRLWVLLSLTRAPVWPLDIRTAAVRHGNQFWVKPTQTQLLYLLGVSDGSWVKRPVGVKVIEAANNIVRIKLGEFLQGLGHDAFCATSNFPVPKPEQAASCAPKPEQVIPLEPFQEWRIDGTLWRLVCCWGIEWTATSHEWHAAQVVGPASLVYLDEREIRLGTFECASPRDLRTAVLKQLIRQAPEDFSKDRLTQLVGRAFETQTEAAALSNLFMPTYKPNFWKNPQWTF